MLAPRIVNDVSCVTRINLMSYLPGTAHIYKMQIHIPKMRITKCRLSKMRIRKCRLSKMTFQNEDQKMQTFQNDDHKM